VRNGSIGYIAAIAIFVGISGCPKNEKADAGAEADAKADASAEASTSTSDGPAIVRAGCLSCHSQHMLAQQRLTQVQWAKVVTKMVAWGANVEPAEVGPLVAHLSASYGLDAGPYESETIATAEAPAELAVTGDDPFPAGDAARGRALYIERCSACHGGDARGHIGVALIDRPFLYRPADFARTVRAGRGKMLPLALTDAEIGDVLAHLRGLRNSPP
jgi:mono/diheme cytochrome c family protein